MKDSAFYKDQSIQVSGRLVDFNKPLTMGIINLTADSFFAGSRAANRSEAMAKAENMLNEGADIIDMGAYSTRPGAADVKPEAERIALIESIEVIKSKFPSALVSVDTFRAKIARDAIAAGADMINDVGGGELDPAMFETAAGLGVPYVLMHNRGTPQTMKSKAVYTDLMGEVIKELSEKLAALRKLGMADVIIDPGFGFAKTIDQNFEMLMRLEEFHLLGAPLLVGLSRKSTIWKTLGSTAGDALNGTTALHMLALERGCHILRVHDVKPAREAIALWARCEANKGFDKPFLYK